MGDWSWGEVEKVVDYCAEEVLRQQRGPLQVAAMVRAWLDAFHDVRGHPITLTDIASWGQMVEPDKNRDGFRTVQVYVGDHVPPAPQEVPARMERFVAHLPDMTPEEAYFEFEEIHPFVDGNGRVGKIILNLRAGTLLDPIWPSNRWGISNP